MSVNSEERHLELMRLLLDVNNEEEMYLKLLDILLAVVEANKGRMDSDPIDDRFIRAEGLATKFFLHAASVLYLSRGTTIQDLPTMPLKFTDPGSIDVLVRAAYETYLVFHYVFSDPNDIEEQNLRYWTWKASGLAERQHYPLLEEQRKQNKQKLEREKAELRDLRKKLLSSVHFQRLRKEQQKKVLDYLDTGKGDWKLQTWRQIAESAGLTEMISLHFYRHLCGYAHSGFVSIFQIREALENKEQSRLMRVSINVIFIATANFIREYCELFPRTKPALSAYPNGEKIVDAWVKLGRMSDIESQAQSAG